MLSEVIQLLEGPIAPIECVDNPKTCPRSELCVTHNIWGEVKGSWKPRFLRCPKYF